MGVVRLVTSIPRAACPICAANTVLHSDSRVFFLEQSTVTSYRNVPLPP